MILKFERYPGFSCLFVRGLVDENKFKMLLVGIKSLLQMDQEHLILNLANSQLSPNEGLILTQFKKSIGNRAHPCTWITKEKGLGDFPTVDVFVSRVLTQKHKIIGHKIELDDELYLLKNKVAAVEGELVKLGGSDDDVRKIILDNEMLKTQRTIFLRVNKWHRARLSEQQKLPTPVAPLTEEIRQAYEKLQPLLKPILGPYAQGNEDVKL